MNDTFAIIAVTGIDKNVMDIGLAQVITSVDKAVMLERYLWKRYSLRLSDEDFEHIFDIIHN